MTKRYVSSTTAFVYDIDKVDKRGRPIKRLELLWGDKVKVLSAHDDDLVKVEARQGEGRKKLRGLMRRSDLQEGRLLELTFVDIGQGDGCLLITPDGRQIVIDAGEGDNMMRFLKYRLGFPDENRPARLHAAIISHPDSDHYRGFKHVFAMPGVTFRNLYHNGLVERRGDDALGPRTDGTPRLYTDLIQTTAQLKKLLRKNAELGGRKQYPDMLHEALRAKKVAKVEMLSRDDGYVPGFGSEDDVTIEVLGPVIEEDQEGRRGLRSFGPLGKTKNGHSVVLRLTYGGIKILLGGDLNAEAETLLLETVVGRPLPRRPRRKLSARELKELRRERDTFMQEAREVLRVDVAKCCHHGSADFSSLFLDALCPVATVISSGDDEPHSHPRSDTLGAIGSRSRGERPLIFSTELARSSREVVHDSRKVIKEIKSAYREVLAHEDADERRARQKVLFEKLDKYLQRSVHTHGAIYLRTDGERLVIAQKIERPSKDGQYDVYLLEPNEDGELAFVSRESVDEGCA